MEHVKKNYENLLIAKELPNVGHWTAEEAPVEVNRLLLDFMSKIKRLK
jgi:pimeloyl-ACP methyl ester carboxylesterase